MGESLSAKRARVERLERDVTTDTEKGLQLLSKCWETSQTASRQLAEDWESR